MSLQVDGHDSAPARERIDTPLEERSPRGSAVKFMLLTYNDKSLLEALPAGEFDSRMRSCLAHADDLRDRASCSTRRFSRCPRPRSPVRIRNSPQLTTDGPFAETKELIAGFNVVEAESMEEAVNMAAEFPWARTGCVEVRPIVDFADVRVQVGAAPAGHPAPR